MAACGRSEIIFSLAPLAARIKGRRRGRWSPKKTPQRRFFPLCTLSCVCVCVCVGYVGEHPVDTCLTTLTHGAEIHTHTHTNRQSVGSSSQTLTAHSDWLIEVIDTLDIHLSTTEQITTTPLAPLQFPILEEVTFGGLFHMPMQLITP